MIEALGFLASALVVLSLMMTSVVRLRAIGLVGAFLFAVYGALVGSIPVLITNAVIFGLHAYFLRRLLGQEEAFTLVEVKPDAAYLLQFLDFYADDIRRDHPHFAHDPAVTRQMVFVLRDMVPAGLFIGHRTAGATMEVDLDYVVPQFRDLRPAAFLFRDNRAMFNAWGVRRLLALASTPMHRNYLLRVGFLPVGGDRYELDLDEVEVFSSRRGGGMRPFGRG